MISHDRRGYYFAEVVKKVAEAKGISREDSHYWIKQFLVTTSINSMTDEQFDDTMRKFRFEMSKEGITIDPQKEPPLPDDDDFDDQSDGCFSPPASNLPEGYDDMGR